MEHALLIILIKFMPTSPRTEFFYLGTTDIPRVLLGLFTQNHHQPKPTAVWRTQHYPDYERDGNLFTVCES